MAEKSLDKEFTEYVVKLLVNNPKDVKVERKIDEMGVLITLDVNPGDMGMIHRSRRRLCESASNPFAGYRS